MKKCFLFTYHPSIFAWSSIHLAWSWGASSFHSGLTVKLKRLSQFMGFCFFFFKGGRFALQKQVRSDIPHKLSNTIRKTNTSSA
jgi:hypothetical protein